MKRICNLVCTIIFTVLFITLINIVVRANEPEPEGWDLRGLYGNDLHQSGDFQYLVYPDMDNRAIIIGYLGTDKNLVIPNMLDGHIVEGVFNLRRKEPIKTIMLGENFGEYQALGKRDNSAMFNNISELEKIKVSKKNKYYTASKGILYSKDMTVLYNCPANLKKSKVKIPKSVKRIYDAAFDYNSTIKKIIFSKKAKVTALDINFRYMKLLEEITLCPGIRTIMDSFVECPNLRIVRLKTGLESIEESFQFLDSIETVSLPDSLERIGEGVFMCCTSMKNVIIPESVGYIGSCSFDNDDGIERIIVCPYMVKGLVQLDSGAYYASVVIDGEQKDVMGIKSIRPTELFYEMKSGVKKRISLLCEYEEWVLDDDGYDYTGEVATGKIDEKSLETGIVSFVSDNPDIVSVSETGVIATGLPGKATITIQMVPEKRLCAKLVVKVTER